MLMSKLLEFDWDDDHDDRSQFEHSWCRGVMFRIRGKVFGRCTLADTCPRFADGSCSKPFDCGSLGLSRCVRGNLICTAVPTRDGQVGACDVVEANTGRLLARTEEDSVVDSSGAHIWLEPDHGLFASSAPGATACQLLNVDHLGVCCVREFRHGVLVVDVGDQCRVLRFDGQCVEPDRKVSWLCWCWCAAWLRVADEPGGGSSFSSEAQITHAFV